MLMLWLVLQRYDHEELDKVCEFICIIIIILNTFLVGNVCDSLTSWFWMMGNILEQ